MCANKTSEHSQGNQWWSAQQQLRLQSQYIYVQDTELDNL